VKVARRPLSSAADHDADPADPIANMKLSLRWYGPDDAVRLAYMAQIPDLTGIVTALHEIPPGVAWSREAIDRRHEAVQAAGLRWVVAESVPVPEPVKLGSNGRDAAIEAWCQSLEVLGASGVPVVCYNFMPVFDWMRTDLAERAVDGSFSPAFREADLSRFDLDRGFDALPAWAESYTPARLRELRDAYARLDSERIWDHLGYFLERVVPIAESAGVRLALHPDDPPWPVFGIPRIISDGASLRRVLELDDRTANGLTFCTGSLGARSDCDLPALVREIGSRIHFAHCRNVRRLGPRDFVETAHSRSAGDVDLPAVLRAYLETGFDGPMRPDHGRMIWGETGRPAYGLYDRALGASYLSGAWHALGGSLS
jgi:mannonate dehydratase